jgi:dihydroneopterin aldolase/2-amino-4-hydroxy-6-hydroxymethyldihydropteridine diphosphokinase
LARAFVSVGSNIDPYNNVKRALLLLRHQASIVGISTVYLTPAEDRPEQAAYYNCIVGVDTQLPALQFKLSVLRPIEDAIGRVRTGDKYAARPIDLDLVLYDDLVLETEELALPAPEIQTRPYVAIPLGELAPELVLPGSDKTISEIVGTIEKGMMEPLESYTRLLRKELFGR